MKHLASNEVLVRVVAVVLMLGGAALMIADQISAGIAIPLIAVGIALSLVVQRRRAT